MQVPSADNAIVSREKVVDYLLNPEHPDGAGKANFFHDLGFREEQWELLTNALRTQLQRSPVAHHVDSDHGAKYIVARDD